MDVSKGSNQDRTGEIDREDGSASCEHDIVAHDRSSPNQMVRLSRGNFPLKTDVFSLLLLNFD